MISDYNDLNNNLDNLKLNRIKEVLPSYLDKDIFDESQLIPFLKNLTDEEIRFRDKRAKDINISVSGFPYIKTIDQFDFSFQPSLSKNKIMELMSLRFVENAENIIFSGLPGTGKTMLSTCIGIEAASRRISTYFITCARLIEHLKKALYENRLDKYIRQITRNKLLIIDEVGFLPLNKGDANLLFQLITSRYEKKSIIFTTNIELSKWGEIFNDAVIATAILDRVLHHCHLIQIDGPSYRTKDIIGS